jgi:phosphatidylserine/phosphatidylglycerophosphate/cardiolipin synthase-like enzyme
MKIPFLFALLLSFSTAQAKVEALFHPHDPTLEQIGRWIGEARGHIDIAMYNMDVSDSSPVVQALKSPAVKARLDNGTLKIRLIYEGYGTGAENRARMDEIEALGPDVRYLGKGVKVHHKFAVIDDDRVVSGSANWSMSSYRNYDENILFFDHEPEAVFRFQQEFLRLWANCKEHGKTLSAEPPPPVVSAADQADLKIHFNSPRHLKSSAPDGEYLTEQVVRVLDNAKAEADIATTRIRLEPILDAVARAAERGVKVRIVLSQDDYHDLYKRAKWLFNKTNIQLRVKFYNLKAGAYMTYQMHNKFMIADRATILTGSFNWSKSSEEGHIENLIEITGPTAQALMPSYMGDFTSIWEMGRADFPALVERLDEIRARGQKPPCGFAPTALEYMEIRKLLRENSSCGG